MTKAMEHCDDTVMEHCDDKNSRKIHIYRKNNLSNSSKLASFQDTEDAHHVCSFYLHARGFHVSGPD